MIKFLAVLLSFVSIPAFGLVSGPESSVVEGEWMVDLRYSSEAGKQKPLENPNSWSNTEITQNIVGVSYGLGGVIPATEDNYLRLEYRGFKSKDEVVNGKNYYDADTGSIVTLLYSLKLLKTTDSSMSMYLGVSPLTKHNKEKFGNPRVDLYQAGMSTSSLFLNYGLFDALMHYGSGVKGQNKYVLMSSTLGLRVGQAGQLEPAIKTGPYIEVDTSDRKDLGYEADFGSQTDSDKIRQWKYAMVTSFELTFKRKYVVSLTRVKKLAGQDLRSTEASSIALAAKF